MRTSPTQASTSPGAPPTRPEPCAPSAARRPLGRVVKVRGKAVSKSRQCDQVIRENPASRGTETSAEELVGPPWRMVSNAGQQQWYGGYPCTLDGGPMGHSARSTVPPPPIRLFSRRRKASGEHVG